MPSKRFLGLGFTFSATDRGLEKKLLGIQGALAGISESLKSINSEADAASASLGSMKSPKKSSTLKSASSRKSSSSKAKSKDPASSLLAELTFLNKTVEKGFSDVLKTSKDSTQTLSNHLIAQGAFFGDVIKAIEENKVDIVMPTKEKAEPKSKAMLKVMLSATDRNVLKGMSDKLSKMLVVMAKCCAGGGGGGHSSSTNKGGSSQSKSKSDYTRERFSDAMKMMSEDAKKEIENIFDSILKNLGPTELKNAKKLFETLKIDIDSLGNVSESSYKHILDLVGDVVKAGSEAAAVSKSFTKLMKVMEVFKHYIGDVSSSVKNLFSTLGADFSKMIPEQFKALYGVVDSAILKPIKASFGAVFGLFKKSKSEKIQQYVWDSIGHGSKNKNVIGLLKDIKNNTKSEKSKSKLCDFLAILTAPLALAAGALVGFAEAMVKIKKETSGLSVFEKVSKWASKVVTWFKKLSWVQRFGKTIKTVVTWFKELSWVEKFGEAVTSVVTWFKNLSEVKWISSVFESIGKVVSWVATKFEGVGEFLIKIGSKFAPLFENPIFGFFFKLGKWVGKWIGWPLMIADALFQIYKAFQEGGSALDIAKNALFNIVDSLLLGIPGWIKGKIFPNKDDLTKKKSEPAQTNQVIDNKPMIDTGKIIDFAKYLNEKKTQDNLIRSPDFMQPSADRSMPGNIPPVAKFSEYLDAAAKSQKESSDQIVEELKKSSEKQDDSLKLFAQMLDALQKGQKIDLSGFKLGNKSSPSEASLLSSGSGVFP